jgi:hypothetical protein
VRYTTNRTSLETAQKLDENGGGAWKSKSPPLLGKACFHCIPLFLQFVQYLGTARKA